DSKHARPVTAPVREAKHAVATGSPDVAVRLAEVAAGQQVVIAQLVASFEDAMADAAEVAAAAAHPSAGSADAAADAKLARAAEVLRQAVLPPSWVGPGARGGASAVVGRLQALVEGKGALRGENWRV
ncbi:hypothetical protein HK405_001929, partial [Cladochytrium tenue]